MNEADKNDLIVFVEDASLWIKYVGNRVFHGQECQHDPEDVDERSGDSEKVDKEEEGTQSR